MLNKQALDQGFVDQCSRRGITNPTHIQGLFKIATETTQKQAAAPWVAPTVGALGGAGLGAGLGYGLGGDLSSALYGGAAGATAGGLGGLGYDKLPSYEELYKYFMGSKTPQANG